MSTFSLQIVTPDGLFFDGQAEKLVVRTVTGDVCILARHCNFVTALGMGEAQVFLENEKRTAACIGGMLSVTEGNVRLGPTTFEWAEDIDAERVERAHTQAQQILSDKTSGENDLRMAKARLKRALVRKSVLEQIYTRS